MGLKESPTKGKKRSDLTDMQEAFVNHYCGEANLNAKLAAGMAGYNSPKDIYRKLMTNPKIREKIEEHLEERKRRSWLAEDAILERLWKEAQRTGKGSSHAARINALVYLGKHIGMFREKEEKTGPQKIEYKIVNYNVPNVKQIEATIKDHKQEVLEHKDDEIVKVNNPLPEGLVIKDYSKEE